MTALDEVEGALTRVRQVAGPSVVGIGGGRGRGSGVVVGDGLVVTNAHNLSAEQVEVSFSGTTATARVVGVDVDGDVAVVTADTRDAPTVAWADDVPGPGAVVFALADPGGGGLRATFGVVSAASRAFRGPRGRRITGSLEHTAPLAKGSSGGPLVDGEGRLVGINTHRLAEGFYLALPADDDLRARVEALGRGEAAARSVSTSETACWSASSTRKEAPRPVGCGLVTWWWLPTGSRSPPPTSSSRSSPASAIARRSPSTSCAAPRSSHSP
ncbi:MAG TPA: S1C family serine protease [Acidimicrobiales bacterium]|nr:S1C family serine protease [Acidimicrobiales bacterium]